MEILMENLIELLNSLIPTGSTLGTEFASLNEIIAYLLTLGIIWSFLLRPILKLFRLVK
jgi:hypothetical protein